MRKERLNPGRAGEMITTTRIRTPLGPMLAGADDRGIRFLDFIDRRKLEARKKRLSRRFKAELVPGRNRHLDALEIQLREYFAGKRKKFTVSLTVSGTPFQKKVWTALRRIPYGKARSYGEQARMIGRPTAVRAVARANGDNRIAVVIPCHRIIGSDGTLTGYGGGLWRKEYLLRLEAGKRPSKRR